MTDCDNELTWEEVEEYGQTVDSLRPNDWFAVVLADQTLRHQQVYTGKVVYVGTGSVLVELDRTWESRVRWAPESKVIKLTKERKENS